MGPRAVGRRAVSQSIDRAGRAACDLPVSARCRPRAPGASRPPRPRAVAAELLGDRGRRQMQPPRQFAGGHGHLQRAKRIGARAPDELIHARYVAAGRRPRRGDPAREYNRTRLIAFDQDRDARQVDTTESIRPRPPDRPRKLLVPDQDRPAISRRSVQFGEERLSRPAPTVGPGR